MGRLPAAFEKKSYLQHSMDGFSFYPIVTELQMFMDRRATGVGNPNPGLPIPAIARAAFVTWAFVGENEPGDWTFRLRQNEAIIDAATITMPAGEPGAFTNVAADWSTQVSFQAGETYHCIADGPTKRAVILRAILCFEECHR